jgi:hypothetical protein
VTDKKPKQRPQISDMIMAQMAVDVAELIDTGDFTKERDGLRYLDMTEINMMLCRRAVTREAHGDDKSSERLLRAVATALTLWMEQHASLHGHSFNAIWETLMDPHHNN